jgi:hypothetical protein
MYKQSAYNNNKQSVYNNNKQSVYNNNNTNVLLLRKATRMLAICWIPCMVDEYPYIINELKGDDSLAKYVKRLKGISFYHGCNQESTMETLDLVKF